MQSLTERLRIRAEIRRNIKDRKSVQEGKPDRLADLLEEAASEIERQNKVLQEILDDLSVLAGAAAYLPRPLEEILSQPLEGNTGVQKLLATSPPWEVPVKWPNECNKTVPEALRFLAENDRPRGGESQFNSLHLYQLADEIETAYKDIVK